MIFAVIRQFFSNTIHSGETSGKPERDNRASANATSYALLLIIANDLNLL